MALWQYRNCVLLLLLSHNTCSSHPLPSNILVEIWYI